MAYKSPKTSSLLTPRENPYHLPRKKKALGQHFLLDQSVVDAMIARVKVDNTTSVMEIGCGDGFLTRSILAQTDCKQLRIFEIDEEWITVVKAKIHDSRMNILHENVLDSDWRLLEVDMPWVMIANLPYLITFPFLHKVQMNRHLFNEGVIMIQEEVAQKLVATHGRPFGAQTLFFQHYFDFELLTKILPSAFNPPPKVDSRLVYFKPKSVLIPIADEEGFWKFVKQCFRFPRQNLRNNLKSSAFEFEALGSDILTKRAQQLTFADFLKFWNLFRA